MLDLSSVKLEDLTLVESEDKKSFSAIVKSAPVRVILGADVPMNYQLPKTIKSLDRYIELFNMKLVWAKK